MADIQMIVEETEMITVKTWMGPQGNQGDTGETGDTGPQGLIADVDGGVADSVYGGMDPIDGGDATSS